MRPLYWTRIQVPPNYSSGMDNGTATATATEIVWDIIDETPIEVTLISMTSVGFLAESAKYSMCFGIGYPLLEMGVGKTFAKMLLCREHVILVDESPSFTYNN